MSNKEILNSKLPNVPSNERELVQLKKRVEFGEIGELTLPGLV